MDKLLKKLSDLNDKKDFTDEDMVEVLNTIGDINALFSKKEVVPPAPIDVIRQDEIKGKYTVEQLKKLAAQHKIKDRSKLKTEDQLIEALLIAGVKLE